MPVIVNGLPDSAYLEEHARRELEAQAAALREPGRRQHRLIVGYRDDDERRYALASAEPGGYKIGRCIDCRHDVYGDLGAREAVTDRDSTVACMFCNDQLRWVERRSQQGMITEL